MQPAAELLSNPRDVAGGQLDGRQRRQLHTQLRREEPANPAEPVEQDTQGGRHSGKEQWRCSSSCLHTVLGQLPLTESLVATGPLQFTTSSRTPRLLLPQNEPYVMMVNTSDTELRGNYRFEGFCIDLVNEIAKLRNFNVEFDLVEGGTYGGIDPETGKASGMVKNLLDQVWSASD